MHMGISHFHRGQCSELLPKKCWVHRDCCLQCKVAGLNDTLHTKLRHSLQQV